MKNIKKIKKLKKIRIHREGTEILIVSLFLLLLINGVSWYFQPWFLVNVSISIFSTILYLLMVNFFRSPKRTFEGDEEGVVVAPADGKVVVKIWVDQYGNVTKAQAGVEGTTATDKTLWQAAYKAALGAHFNMDASAPPLQEGTITYIFRIR